ncbi:MAG: glycosyltransferase [Microthrixaceae bacterium]|nr:glycosyltransferase [Microthrixaceae bacterium]
MQASGVRIRVVVVNWNSFDFTDKCLASITDAGFAYGEIEVVVIDNASVDGSLEQLRANHPTVRFIANSANLGFAEACNQGMRNRDGVDAIALVNNDATVEAGWLEALWDALDADRRVGAVAAKLILDPGFVVVDPELKVPALLQSVRVDQVDVTARCIVEGGEKIGDPLWPLSVTQLLDAGSIVWVPADHEATSMHLGLKKASRSGAVDPDARDLHVSTSVAPDRTELLNGLGTRRTATGEAYDIGFGQQVSEFEPPDPSQVDGFCGGGVLLRSVALDEVGLFDPRFFAYYEDTDLSWRLTKAGWKIALAPDARIHHAFGGSGGSGAPWFFFLNYRNWFLTTLRNGDRAERRRAFGQLREWVRPAVRANIASRIKHRRMPSLRLLIAWIRVMLGILWELPRIWVVRRSRIGSKPTNSVRSPLQPR